MAGQDDDIVLQISTETSTLKRQLRQLGQDITSATNQWKSSFEKGGAGIDKAFAPTSAVQKRINDLTGVIQKSGKEWQGALFDQGKALDDIRKKYNPLYAAQQQYLQNLKDIKVANAIGAISTNEMAAAVTAEKAAFAGRVAAIGAANKPLKDVATAAKLTSNQMLNLSRQGNDVITMFALGAPPMQIFASQAGQIYDALESGPGGLKGSLKAVGEGAIGLATKFPLATAAVAAAGVAFVAYEVFAEKAAKSVDEILKTHEENIKRLGPAYEEALKGVEKYANESERLANLRFRVDAEDALKRRAADAQTAIENIVKSEGIFSSRFRGAKDAIEAFMQSIKDGNPEAIKFQETIGQLQASGQITERVARDLIAASDAAYTTEQALRGVKDAVDPVAKAIADIADALGNDISSHLSQLSDEQRKYVQDLIEKLKSGEISAKDFKDALASLSGVTPDFSGAIAQVSGLADELERAQRAALGLANTTPKQDRVGYNRMDEAQSQYDNALNMWRRFGYDNDSKLDPNKPKKVRTPRTRAPAKTADDRFFEDIEAIRQRTAALAQEQSMLGATFEEQTKRKTAFDLETTALKQVREAARKKGDQDWQNKQLSPDQVKAIDDVSAAYARQADSLRKTQEAFDLTKDVTKGFLSDFLNDLESGKDVWESFGDAALNALNKIADKLIDMAMDQLIGNIFQSLGGGIGQFPGGFGVASSSGFADMLGLAGGGRVDGPGTGTSDSIPARLSKGEFVVNADATRKFGPLLDAINSGRVLKFAAGGLVGAPRMPAIGTMGGGNLRVEVKNYGEPANATVKQRTDADGNRVIEVMMERKIRDEVTRPSAKTNRALRGAYGFQQQVVSR